jgi:hypothetical protein
MQCELQTMVGESLKKPVPTLYLDRSFYEKLEPVARQRRFFVLLCPVEVQTTRVYVIFLMAGLRAC